ncbi:hypothetical protein VE04_05016 [Pseudogymnoascus sp. 24MN13]|nr:hypothetical protein VE04_05016 [Pseudogymnoascus sp. 24MN13]
MSGPKSVNLAKRDRLIEFTDAARNLPTLVISLNPRTGKQVAFIENGTNKRKVQWMTLWDEVIHWCLTCVHNAKSSNVSLTRIDLPLWKEPKELGSEWWAWGLLQACRQYFETGNFLLKLLLLPPVLRDVPIGAFSNTGAIKPSWCLTSELLALCTSSGVNEWSGFNIRENHQKIMYNPFLIRTANEEAARIGSLQWPAEELKSSPTNESVDTLDGDAIKIDCLKIAAILDRKPFFDPYLCSTLTASSEDRRRRLRAKATLKRKRGGMSPPEELSGDLLDLSLDELSDTDVDI